MTELIPCRYCKCKKAETYKANDLWYVRCKGTRKVKIKVDGVEQTITKRCTAWHPYEFLGLKEEAAIQNWNTRNAPVNKGNKNENKE